MCYMLYAGADHELQLTNPAEWDGIDVCVDGWVELAPPLAVTQLHPQKNSVREHFTEVFIVEVGGYGGCSCGFNRLVKKTDTGGATNDLEPEDLAADRSRRALAAYVLMNGVTALFYCWDGDEELPLEGECLITTAQLADATFSLPERVKLRIAI